MNQILRPCALVSILALYACAQDPEGPEPAPEPPKARETLFDTGFFDHFQGGRRRGYEHFWITKSDGGTISLRGETLIAFQNAENGSDIWQFYPDLQYGVRGFQKYFVRCKYPVGPGQIAVNRNGADTFVVRTLPNQNPGQPEPVTLPLDGLLIDKNNAHHWAIVAARRAAMGKSRLFLDPESGRVTEARLSDPVPAAIETPTRSVLCERTLVTIGAFAALLWHDADGKLLRVEVPHYAISMIRRGYYGTPRLRVADAAAAPAFKTVEFNVQDNRTLLSGTLTIPAGQGPFPAVLIIGDSGPQDRDGNPVPRTVDWNLYRDIADALAARGVASLRWDDPGTGLSFTSLDFTTITDWIAWVRAVIKHAKAEKLIDPARVGAIAHGEGSLIALQLAVNGELPFIALLAGHGMTLDKIMEEQLTTMMARQGADKAEIARELAEMQAVQKLFMDPAIKEWKAPAVPERFLLIGGQRPWFKDLMRFDPIQLSQGIQGRILVVHGRDDRQIPMANFEALKKALTDSKKSATFLDVEGLDHFLMPSVNGEPGDSAVPERKIAPAVLDALGEWLLK
ncbi:MAG: alpha/beta hydrolase [Planctomycetes bacterium]|nr:alpha/beta hydrolase [Planctomycetota bacterium]